MIASLRGSWPRRLLVLLVLALFVLVACGPAKQRRSPRKRSFRPHATPAHRSPPPRPRHPSHEHSHGGHPHGTSDHHHHPHPHPHMTGPGGHHHPY